MPLTTTNTHCPYCAMQCGITLIAGDRPATLTPQEDFPANPRRALLEGWAAVELLAHPERLTTPLMRDRRDASLRPVAWDEALDRIAGEITRAQERYGFDAVGCFGPGG